MNAPQTIYTQEPGKYHAQKTIGGWVVVFIEDRNTMRHVDGGKVHKSRQNAYAKAKRLNDGLPQMAPLNPNQYSITVYPWVDIPIMIDRFIADTKEEALARLAKWCDAEKYSNVSLRDDRGYVVKEWASDSQTQKEIDALRDMHREYKGTQG